MYTDYKFYSGTHFFAEDKTSATTLRFPQILQAFSFISASGWIKSGTMIHLIPAAKAERTPLGLSSIATHSAGERERDEADFK